MPASLPWRTAATVAFRDLRASRTKFLFIALAIAVGIGSLAGVRGFARAFRVMLRAEARTLMAADLSVRVFEEPDPAQTQTLGALAARGARLTRITETVSMLASESGAAPVLVSLKAVDPAAYPFYGAVRLDPPQPLAAALTPGAVAVSEDLLIRLNLRPGARVRLGEADFTIAAVIGSEPDRMAGSLNVGPRVLLSREALARTALIRPGSRAAQRHLVKLDSPALDIARVRTDLRQAFPNALIADYRETHPLITRGLDRSERFLSLVSLIALIVGGLGVAATMHSHLQQRLDTIAIMKCLGARSSSIARIYLLQTAAIGLAGGLVGCILGLAVQSVFPFLIARYFPSTPPLALDPLASFQAIALGPLVAVLFTWPTLIGIREVRPAAIFRRDLVDPARSWRARWFGSLRPWLARLAILAAVASLTAWLAGSDRLRVSAYFTLGLLAALALLAAFAWGLLRALRALLTAAGRRSNPTLRHGVANIYRPGNQAQAVLIALGIGVMFTLSIYLLQHGMLAQILDAAPPGMPNVFLINITSRERAGIERLLAETPGIQGRPELVPVVAARLTQAGARPLDPSRLEGPQRRFRQTRAITFSPGPRPQTELVRGAWWSAASSAPGQVCVLESAARNLNLDLGAPLTFTVGLQTVQGRVVCLYRTEEVRMGANFDFVFSPGSLDHLPLQYFATLRLRPDRVAAFQRTAFSRFPSVTVINGADVIELIQQVVDQIAIVVRFISAFAILAGVIILASAVAATRFRRIREVAILKTLGATRRRVAAIFSVEFTVLGAAAGFLGALLATLFSNLLLVRLLDARLRVHPLPLLAAIAASALIANLAGWLASARILGLKPLEVLRNE